MIKGELLFPLSSLQLILEKLLTLPQVLQPTYRSLGENEVGSPIGDPKRFVHSFELPSSGIYLKASNALYDFRRSRNGSLLLGAYFDGIAPLVAKDFLTHMAPAHPIFGFVCAPEERERRNRVTTRQGVNAIESWVGRDTQKYIPGLYWCTLLSESLAERHKVPLSTIAGLALEHIDLDGEQHLFRFYEKPEDWRSATVVDELYSELSCVFKVEQILPQLERARTFLELNSMISTWS
jgi:hypothetical protein